MPGRALVFLIGTAFPGWTPLPSLSCCRVPGPCHHRALGNRLLGAVWLSSSQYILSTRFVIVRPCPLYSLVIGSGSKAWPDALLRHGKTDI
ncbi:hypothetical protein BJX68DRAFT_242984 [Aspergillus pseudodeflectus]|uniref:Secreted protein n=1 Tax=Aspergillus pseudodeflectus TaxID=176178 RepID=A0ABR4JZV1_9EURO